MQKLNKNNFANHVVKFCSNIPIYLFYYKRVSIIDNDHDHYCNQLIQLKSLQRINEHENKDNNFQ